MEKPSLLIVDDDAILRERLGRAFTERGFAVRLAAGFEEAQALATEDPPELALVDLKMVGRSGLELIAVLKQLDPETNIVVLTGYSSVTTALEAVRLGATHYLPKPADADEILRAFARAKGASFPMVEVTETPSLARAEWEHIDRVMADCEGNISEAARRLGLHRRSLQRKLHKRPPRT
jgi:two-component system response regulator RegA